MHRRFEFVGGTSAKFWEADLHGCKAARMRVEKLIGEKTAKGYRATATAS